MMIYKKILINVIIIFVASCSNSNKEKGTFYSVKLINWSDDVVGISEKEVESNIKNLVKTNLSPIASIKKAYVVAEASLYEFNKDIEISTHARIWNEHLRVNLKVGIVGSMAKESSRNRKDFVNSVLTDLVKTLDSHVRIMEGGPDKWIETLASEEKDELIFALEVIGVEKEKKAITRVLPLLADPRRRVADAALDAALNIAAPKDIALIASLAETSYLEVEARCVELIGHIGGEEAKAWLEMMALGHQDTNVRQLSINVLKRLK